VAEPLRYFGQAVVYLLVAVVLGYFASAPSYIHLPPDQALIKLSFAHGAARKGECRRRTAEELARLAPNMRRPMECPRERLSVEVELLLDGAPLYRAVLPPTGLAGDGPSRVYRRFAVAPGPHRLMARLRDSSRTQGFDHEREAEIELAPGQNFVIDFRKDAGGFVLD
jgi:hypothetical protein